MSSSSRTTRKNRRIDKTRRLREEKSRDFSSLEKDLHWNWDHRGTSERRQNNKSGKN